MKRVGSLLIFLAVFVAACCAGRVRADVRLPSILSDGMVLQRAVKNPIWGWADEGEQVTVTVGEASETITAGDDGRWMVKIDAPPAGGPYAIEVQGKNSIVLKDVLCGEVWLCSGQSNMQWPLRRAKNGQNEINAADYPLVRLFQVARRIAERPQDDCQGQWEACDKDSVANFSAVAFFFGRHLHKELEVPIGLVQAAWGGTVCEAWMSRQVLEDEPEFAPILERAEPFNRRTPNQAANLYNGMIHPLVPLAIRGVIWYQGESNVSRAQQYAKLFPALIADWRRAWGQGEFPFLYVQLAPYRYDRKDPAELPELWEAQLKTLALPGTGMVVTTDIGNVKDIHPQNKQEVGRRLGLWALGTVYEREIVHSGPLYDSYRIEDNKIRIQFKHVDGGLVARDGELTHFTIAGEDEEFVPARAAIDGETIVVSSDQVPTPVAVRFAWRDDAEPNLFNEAGLPASPFRTDHWQLVTEGRR